MNRNNCVKIMHADKFCSLLIMVICLMTLVVNSASSQNFMVKPMRISFSVRPGQTIEQNLELRNLMTERNSLVELKCIDVKQGDNGAWMAIESSNVNSSEAQGRSCRSWLTMDSATMDIKPVATANVSLKVTVPQSARGVYVAGITAQTLPDRNAKGISMLLRFLIPVIVEINGPPIRQQVELTSADLMYLAKTEMDPAKTVVSIGLANTGEAYSRLKSVVKVSKQEGDRWRQLSTIKFDEKKILPTQKFCLFYVLPRNFPSGKYQLIASLDMDGRSVKPLIRIVDFVGDPAVSSVSADVELSMEPARIESDAIPGSRRTVFVMLRNPSEEDLMITAAAEEPQALKGVMLGEIKGDDYSGASWVQFNPAKFPLRKHSERKIAIQLVFPREGLDKAAYYSDLNLVATYPDGQLAGVVKALAILKNKKSVSTTRMYGQTLSMVQASANQYNVNAVFANVGNIYLDPECRGELMAANLMSAIKPFEMKRDPGLVLPLGTPNFSGTLNISDVPTGTYVLKVACNSVGNHVTESFPVKITEQEGNKSMDVIGDLTRE